MIEERLDRAGHRASRRPPPRGVLRPGAGGRAISRSWPGRSRCEDGDGDVAGKRRRRRDHRGRRTPAARRCALQALAALQAALGSLDRVEGHREGRRVRRLGHRVSPISRRWRTERATSWSRSSGTRAGTRAPRSGVAGAPARSGRRGRAPGRGGLSRRALLAVAGPAREAEVARATRHAGAVEVLEQRHRVLPRRSEGLPQRAHGDARVPRLAHGCLGSLDEPACQHEVGRDPDEAHPNGPPRPRLGRRTRAARSSAIDGGVGSARRDDLDEPAARPHPHRTRWDPSRTKAPSRTSPPSPSSRPMTASATPASRGAPAEASRSTIHRRTVSTSSPAAAGSAGVGRGEPGPERRSDLVEQVPIEPPAAEAHGAVRRPRAQRR